MSEALGAGEAPCGHVPCEIGFVEHSDDEQNASGHEIVDKGRHSDRAQAGTQNTQCQHAGGDAHRATAAANH